MVNFYGRSPCKGDLTVCRIDSISDTGGYWVELLEYDNRVGFVGLKEITQAKWFRHLRGLASEGDIEVMQIVAIGDNGDVDLTRRYITEKSRRNIMMKYKTWKKIYDYLDHMVEDSDREKIVHVVVHPFHEWLEKKELARRADDGIDGEEMDDTMDDEDDEDDDESADNNAGKIEFSRWIDEHVVLQDFEPPFRSALNTVVKLVERPIDLRIQQGHVLLANLIKMRVNTVNGCLKDLAETFSVDIVTYNTKGGVYQVQSREKMSHEQFVNLLAKLAGKDPMATNARTESSSSSTEKKNFFAEDGERKQPLLNIGIVGHVAHGKTTLIEAFTGVDTRRYKREVASNRTLNIGYTNATVCKCTCADVERPRYAVGNPLTCDCPRHTVSIVDCPGHNVLLSTMITGAHVMDTCILVVAADEPCPRPQTKEHAAVLQIVGTRSGARGFAEGLIVQNKVDLVSEDRIRCSKSEIDDFVQGTMFQHWPIVPASAQMRLNTDLIAKFIYDRAERVATTRADVETNARISKGIVVRTFDINKPGSKTVKGTVIGGSVVNGAFSVGEDIILLPSAVEAKILSMKSEKTDLQSARSGGLIAIQTDINPSYCNVLVGSTFLNRCHFDPTRLLSAASVLKVKYHLLHGCDVKRLNKQDKITINYSGYNVDATVIRSSKEKYRMAISLAKALYVHPNEEMNFTIVADRRLIGFGRCNEIAVRDREGERKINIDFTNEVKDHDEDDVVEALDYEVLLEAFKDKLQVWKETSMQKMKVPVPHTTYKNTFTTVVNFDNICRSLSVNPEELGKFVCQELGLKGWSVNASRQLVMKGRTDQRKVISVLHRYIMEKRCLVCRQNTVKTVRNMGVKQSVCTNCSWKG